MKRARSFDIIILNRRFLLRSIYQRRSPFAGIHYAHTVDSTADSVHRCGSGDCSACHYLVCRRCGGGSDFGALLCTRLASVGDFRGSVARCACGDPPARQEVFKKRVQPTNADRYIGLEGIVEETVDNTDGTGIVKVAGSTWTARSSDGSRIEKGSNITVDKIDGVKLMVSKH